MCVDAHAKPQQENAIYPIEAHGAFLCELCSSIIIQLEQKQWRYTLAANSLLPIKVGRKGLLNQFIKDNNLIKIPSKFVDNKTSKNLIVSIAPSQLVFDGVNLFAERGVIIKSEGYEDVKILNEQESIALVVKTRSVSVLLDITAFTGLIGTDLLKRIVKDAPVCLLDIDGVKSILTPVKKSKPYVFVIPENRAAKMACGNKHFTTLQAPAFVAGDFMSEIDLKALPSKFKVITTSLTNANLTSRLLLSYVGTEKKDIFRKSGDLSRAEISNLLWKDSPFTLKVERPGTISEVVTVSVIKDMERIKFNDVEQNHLNIPIKTYEYYEFLEVIIEQKGDEEFLIEYLPSNNPPVELIRKGKHPRQGPVFGMVDDQNMFKFQHIVDPENAKLNFFRRGESEPFETLELNKFKNNYVTKSENTMTLIFEIKAK